MFRSNLPTIERLARLLLGFGIAAFASFAPAQPNLAFSAIGLCIAATGLIGFCPACALAGRRPTPKS